MKSASLRSGALPDEKQPPSTPASPNDKSPARQDAALIDNDIDVDDEMDAEQMKNGVWRVAMLPAPPLVPVQLHIDEEVLQWFRQKGDGCEYLINYALRTYYNTYKDTSSAQQ